MKTKRVIILEDIPDLCPVCGSMRLIKIADVWGKEYLIKCKRCGHKGPKAEKLSDAVRLWNKQNAKKS
jgi:predicted RNA-binding Zn-ribbon protein involved in translation (DUF1610 family)